MTSWRRSGLRIDLHPLVLKTSLACCLIDSMALVLRLAAECLSAKSNTSLIISTVNCNTMKSSQTFFSCSKSYRSAAEKSFILISRVCLCTLAVYMKRSIASNTFLSISSMTTRLLMVSVIGQLNIAEKTVDLVLRIGL